ncbi:MAG: hypothetical protein KGL35_08340 [Bradyrhizobium sp.]|nr:hypothetical protein [Bradyrhizobium sp.]
MPNPRFTSRCGRYTLELFWRRDRDGNASIGFRLEENGGGSHVFEFERQATAREAAEWIDEKLGRHVIQGLPGEGQQA